MQKFNFWLCLLAGVTFFINFIIKVAKKSKENLWSTLFLGLYLTLTSISIIYNALIPLTLVIGVIVFIFVFQYLRKI